MQGTGKSDRNYNQTAHATAEAGVDAAGPDVCGSAQRTVGSYEVIMEGTGPYNHSARRDCSDNQDHWKVDEREAWSVNLRRGE